MLFRHDQVKIDTTQIQAIWFSELSHGDFARLYFLEIVLLLSLVAITIFRREMSCNHCYADGIEMEASSSSAGTDGSINNSHSRRRNGPGNSNGDTQSTSMILDWNDEQADSVLEGATGFYSGSSLLFPFLSKVFRTPIVAIFFYLPELLSIWWKSSETLSLEDILDGAENYYSGRRFFMPSSTRCPPPFSIVIRQPSSFSSSSSSTISDNEDFGKNETIFTSFLPADTTIHILSFLHPKDIVSGFGCVSKACHEFINDDPWYGMLDEHAVCSAPSGRLWKKMFERDYQWLLESWSIGRQAKQQSFESSKNLVLRYTKEFYFRFGLSYLNYVIAGHNSASCCLVGLAGHIYDLTGFLSSHPGSSETVLVHAGRDATSDFARMRHTNRALRLAEQLCIIVDTSLAPNSNYVSGNIGVQKSERFGVRPTKQLVTFDKATIPVANLPCHVDAEAPVTSLHSPTIVMKSIAKIRIDFQKEQVKAYADACYQFGSEALEDVNVYYDPLLQRWRLWYIDSVSLENVFVDCDCWL